MAGLWIMILSVLSVFVTAPLRIGFVSGVAFAIGLMVLWSVSLLAFIRRIARWVSLK